MQFVLQALVFTAQKEGYSERLEMLKRLIFIISKNRRGLYNVLTGIAQLTSVHDADLLLVNLQKMAHAAHQVLKLFKKMGHGPELRGSTTVRNPSIG